MARKSKSEEAGAAWYASSEGRRQTQREFERALRQGTLVSSPGLSIPQTDPKILASLVSKAEENATKPVSLRIPVADLNRARRIAEEKGVGYQTVLKKAIRSGLAHIR